MKKCFLGILVLTVGFFSCSKDEVKSQNQETSRPSVPVQAGEVQIGNQIWMTKNLNVSRYRNGDPIPQVTDVSQWRNLTTGAWCYYANNTTHGKVYGKLYNWFAVNDPRGLAPEGWHVASDTEWTVLSTFLGGESIAGEKLKTIQGWSSPNVATNSSGFSSLPGGGRNPEGDFYNVNAYSDYWTSTEEVLLGNNIQEWAWMRFAVFTNSFLYRNYTAKKCGLSVRCVKD